VAKYPTGLDDKVKDLGKIKVKRFVGFCKSAITTCFVKANVEKLYA